MDASSREEGGGLNDRGFFCRFPFFFFFAFFSTSSSSSQPHLSAPHHAKTDQDAFFAACDPSRENLCLYGEPGGGDGDGDGEGEAAATWRVAPPADEVPPEIPEPCLGINFARDGMRRSDWVALVAVHSDAWLRSVAWYFGARLDKAGRAELFAKLNSRPSLYEVATGRSRSGLQAKMQKKAAAEAAANKANGGAANGGALPPPPARRQPGADPDEGVVLGAGGARAASAPLATGRLISSADAADPTFTAALVGRRCELLWPDDGLWYLVEILEVDSSSGASAGTTARARYSSGEEEVLSLQEVAEKGELSLLAD